MLLAAEGAERFAAGQGMALCDPAGMIAPGRMASEYAKAHDTVGCVAIDAQGHIASGTSTGGLPGKHPGRSSSRGIVSGCWDRARSISSTVPASPIPTSRRPARSGHCPCMTCGCMC
nr:isoaspartyl peptidase/L-asparaginase [Sphingobium chlorophenolicum]